HHNALKSSLQLSSKTWITVGTITATLFGPLFWRNFKNVAHCAESPAPETAAKKSEPKKIPSSTPPGTSGQNEKGSLINTKEISFGGAMGLCSGYLFKKLGKMFLLVAGLGFVSLQLLANTGYIQVNWVKIESQFKDKFDLDGDGQVTVKDARFGLQWIIDLLTKNFQFKSTFAGGFMLGFRYG
ncbi:FUN14 domain-containing protein 1, partial [Lunasporangiospora selenospora]